MEEAKGPSQTLSTQALLDTANSDPLLFHPPGPGDDMPIPGQSSLNNALGVEDNEANDDTISQKKKKRKRKNKKKNKKKGASSVCGESDQSLDVTKNDTTMDGQDELEFTPLKEKIDQDFFDNQDSSEDEGMPDYKIGGYHPVHVGEILLDRYIIIQKLGWGHFSTVWLTKDLKYNSYVAIKVQKSAQHYLEAAYDEVEILDQVAKNWRTIEWADSIKEYYKNDEILKNNLERFGMTGDTSHCV